MKPDEQLGSKDRPAARHQLAVDADGCPIVFGTTYVHESVDGFLLVCPLRFAGK